MAYIYLPILRIFLDRTRKFEDNLRINGSMWAYRSIVLEFIVMNGRAYSLNFKCETEFSCKKNIPL